MFRILSRFVGAPPSDDEIKTSKNSRNRRTDECNNCYLTREKLFKNGKRTTPGKATTVTVASSNEQKIEDKSVEFVGLDLFLVSPGTLAHVINLPALGLPERNIDGMELLKQRLDALTLSGNEIERVRQQLQKPTAAMDRLFELLLPEPGQNTLDNRVNLVVAVLYLQLYSRILTEGSLVHYTQELHRFFSVLNRPTIDLFDTIAKNTEPFWAARRRILQSAFGAESYGIQALQTWGFGRYRENVGKIIVESNQSASSFVRTNPAVFSMFEHPLFSDALGFIIRLSRAPIAVARDMLPDPELKPAFEEWFKYVRKGYSLPVPAVSDHYKNHPFYVLASTLAVHAVGVRETVNKRLKKSEMAFNKAAAATAGAGSEQRDFYSAPLILGDRERHGGNEREMFLTDSKTCKEPVLHPLFYWALATTTIYYDVVSIDSTDPNRFWCVYTGKQITNPASEALYYIYKPANAPKIITVISTQYFDVQEKRVKAYLGQQSLGSIQRQYPVVGLEYELCHGLYHQTAEKLPDEESEFGSLQSPELPAVFAPNLPEKSPTDPVKIIKEKEQKIAQVWSDPPLLSPAVDPSSPPPTLAVQPREDPHQQTFKIPDKVSSKKPAQSRSTVSTKTKKADPIPAPAPNAVDSPPVAQLDSSKLTNCIASLSALIPTPPADRKQEPLAAAPAEKGSPKKPTEEKIFSVEVAKSEPERRNLSDDNPEFRALLAELLGEDDLEELSHTTANATVPAQQLPAPEMESDAFWDTTPEITAVQPAVLTTSENAELAKAAATTSAPDQQKQAPLEFAPPPVTAAPPAPPVAAVAPVQIAPASSIPLLAAQSYGGRAKGGKRGGAPVPLTEEVKSEIALKSSEIAVAFVSNMMVQAMQAIAKTATDIFKDKSKSTAELAKLIVGAKAGAGEDEGEPDGESLESDGERSDYEDKRGQRGSDIYDDVPINLYEEVDEENAIFRKFILPPRGRKGAPPVKVPYWVDENSTPANYVVQPTFSVLGDVITVVLQQASKTAGTDEYLTQLKDAKTMLYTIGGKAYKETLKLVLGKTDRTDASLVDAKSRDEIFRALAQLRTVLRMLFMPLSEIEDGVKGYEFVPHDDDMTSTNGFVYPWRFKKLPEVQKLLPILLDDIQIGIWEPLETYLSDREPPCRPSKNSASYSQFVQTLASDQLYDMTKAMIVALFSLPMPKKTAPAKPNSTENKKKPAPAASANKPQKKAPKKVNRVEQEEEEDEEQEPDADDSEPQTKAKPKKPSGKAAAPSAAPSGKRKRESNDDDDDDAPDIQAVSDEEAAPAPKRLKKGVPPSKKPAPAAESENEDDE